MTKPAVRYAVLGAIALLLVGVIAARWWYGRGQVSYLFDIKDVPWSVSSVNCESIFTSDTLLTCAFRVDPADLPKLLATEQFSQVPVEIQRVHDFGMSLELGENFVPSTHYFAVPKGADHGGAIDVFTDASKTRVLAHLYIE